jgi:hypothetical protein
LRCEQAHYHDENLTKIPNLNINRPDGLRKLDCRQRKQTAGLWLGAEADERLGEQLLKRLERRLLSGAGNFRQGSTPYDNLTVAVKFADGIATAEDIRIDSPTSRVTLTGTAIGAGARIRHEGRREPGHGLKRQRQLRLAFRGAGSVG